MPSKNVETTKKTSTPPKSKKAPTKAPANTPAKAPGRPKKTATPPATVEDGVIRSGLGPNKLTPAAIDFIIDMTIAGYTDDEILAELKAQFKVIVNPRALWYHRNKNAARLSQSYAAELDTARARSNLSSLSRRMVIADEMIKKEMKRKRPSLYGIASLLGTADAAIHRAEMRRMKYDELARRNNDGGDVQREEILALIEKRTALILEAEAIDSKLMELAESEFLVQAPRQLASLKQDVKKVEPLPVDAVEGEAVDAEEGLGEDVLTV